MRKNTIDIITLGCSKNLVDSEKLMKQLEANGYKVTHDSENPQGEIAVINTCGFIGDAKEESINMILEFCQAKEEGRLKKLYVMGCLSERYLKELQVEIPQVDKFYGKFNWNELLADLGKTYQSDYAIERHLTTPKHYAYLKISEGCDRKCSVLCYSYHYRKTCFSSDGGDFRRSPFAGFRRRERISGHCAGVDLLWRGFV